METSGSIPASSIRINHGCIRILDAIKNDQSITIGVRFLGLDYSQDNLYVDNLERQANYSHFYRRSEEKLDKIKKLCTRTVNHQKDYLQELSTKLVEIIFLM